MLKISINVHLCVQYYKVTLAEGKRSRLHRAEQETHQTGFVSGDSGRAPQTPHN